MIELQFLNKKEWTTISKWEHEYIAWISLGGDDINYRTIQNGKVLTDKSKKDEVIDEM